MSDKNIDINIDNYSSDELYDILDITVDTCRQEIIDTTDSHIQRFKQQNNEKLVTFFEDVKKRLLAESEEEHREYMERYDDEVINEEERNKLGSFTDKKLNPREMETTDILINIDSAFRKNI